MRKLFFIVVAIIMPLGSLLLAKSAINDMPAQIDAGRIRIMGAGSPAVVFEIGLGGPLEEWAAVQSEVARFARTFAYDRIGTIDHPQMLTGRQVALELHTALANSHVPPPYVLVGQSFAGVYNQVFAQMYPDEVAGMVLLDSPTAKFVDWMRTHHPDKEFTLMRHDQWPEANGILPTFDELRNGGPLPDVPVVVVTAARPSEKKDLSKDFKVEMLAVWKAEHEALANSLVQGRHVITEKSGHGIQVEQPELVVDLIREVVEQTRNSSVHVSHSQGE